MLALARLGRRGAAVLALWTALATAAPAAAQVPLQSLGGAPALDLAAVVLAPEEAPEPGYGVADRLSGAVDFAGAAERLAGTRIDASVGNMSDALRGGGFVAGYWSTLAFPTVPGDAGSPIARLVVSWVVEFESADGAARAFETFEDESGLAGAKDLPITRALGDQTDATRLTVPVQGAEPAPVVEVAFRSDRLVAEVQLLDFQGRQPDAAAAERLAARLLERAEWVAAGNGPRLGSRLLRVTPWDDTRPLHDRYDRWGDRALPGYGEDEGDAASASDSRGTETTAYSYRFHHPGNGSYYVQRVAIVPSREDAAAWLAGWKQRWLGAANNGGYGDIALVSESPGNADAATVVSYTWTDANSGKIYRGYAAALRFGTVVIKTQIHTTSGLPEQLAVGLLQGQFNCFTMGKCGDPEAFLLLHLPGLFVPGVPSAAGA